MWLMPAPSLVRIVRSRPWLVTAAIFATALSFGLTEWIGIRLSQAILIAWNSAAILYLCMAARIMFSGDTDDLRRRAEDQDVGRQTILLLTGLAILVCIIAIATELSEATRLHGQPRLLALGLAGATLLTTWLFVHTIFALHYAHGYYLAVQRASEPPLIFPDSNATPDYLDFAYFAFIIGAAAQTADVAIASKGMRRLALGHCVFAFAFNTTILAVAINLAASLIG
jgi:uncharacterized membrane protein